MAMKVRKSRILFNSWGSFILLNLIIAAVLVMFQCPKCLLSLTGIYGILPEFSFSFLMSSSLSFGGSKVEDYFDTRISWIEQPGKRLILTAVSYLVYSFVISFILVTGYVLITVEAVTVQNISWTRIIANTRFPILVAMFIISIFISRSWLFEWRNTAIEAEQLKSENLASQYQSLKDQLNPHFLFNSLNVLSNLVYENADKSAAFIQQLAKIYRYVLDVQEEELVSLEKELDFAENYLSLQKIRFEESLEYYIDVNQPKGYFIPPLSLQLLLENAVKHNVASLKNPLKILIVQEGDVLKVKNLLQPKLANTTVEKGIGLVNIKRRYALLSNHTPQIIKTAHEFIVELPLLKLSTA